VPPRFSPRDCLKDPKSFGDRAQDQSWLEPADVQEARQLLVAHYMHEVCAEVREALGRRSWDVKHFAEVLGDSVPTVQKKLRGEAVPQPEDVLLWALVLDRPEVVFAPGDARDLVPAGLGGAFGRLRLGTKPKGRS
jgi:hypothetical protein